MATVDDYFLDETGAAILDETGANILTTQIPKATSSTWYLSDLQSETGLDICDENGYPILMPNDEVVTSYEWWTGSVWYTEETFINQTTSPITITNWPDRVEAFELSVRAKDSAGGLGDYTTIYVAPGKTIQPTAIASSQAMGAPTINTTVNISPGGIASAQAMGNPTFSSIQTISPGGIASAGALGAPTIVRGAVTILPGAIASAEALGAPTIQAIITLLPGAINLPGQFLDEFNSLVNWTDVSASGGGTHTLGAGVLVGTLTASGAIVSRKEVDAASTDMFAEVTVVSFSAPNGRPSVAARFSAVANTFYMFGYNHGNNAAELYTCVAGTFTLIAQTFMAAPAFPYTLRLECQGNKIYGSINGAKVVSVVDSTIAAGTRAGIRTQASSASTTTFDNFKFGTLDAGVPTLVNGPVTFQPSAIASAEAMGNPTIFATISLLPVGIASAQALGAPTLLNTVAVVTGDSLFVAVDGLAVEGIILVVSDTPTIHLLESTHLFKTYISGPPPDEIMLAAIAPVTRVTRRVDIYEADGITPYLLNAPFMDGNVTVDMGRDERRMFDLKLYNEDGALTINPDGFWYDKIIKLYRGIRTDTVAWERKLGEFMIDQASNPNFPDETNVSGRDMTKKMRQSKFQQATAFPINTPIENIILALAINSGVPADKIDLPLTGKSTGKEFFYDRETERWAAAKELANSYGYELYFTNEGVLTMTLFADPTLGQPEYTFQTGANGQIASFEKRTADARMYNHIIVTGQVDSTVVAWAEAKNTVVGHPTSIARIGDRSFFYTSAFISTTVQAQDVADKFLKIHALEQFEASLNTIVLPWLDAGTIVDFIDPDPADGDPTRYLLSSLSIPMSLGAMPSVLKRVTAVV